MALVSCFALATLLRSRPHPRHLHDQLLILCCTVLQCLIQIHLLCQCLRHVAVAHLPRLCGLCLHAILAYTTASGPRKILSRAFARKVTRVTPLSPAVTITALHFAASLPQPSLYICSLCAQCSHVTRRLHVAQLPNRCRSCRRCHMRDCKCAQSCCRQCTAGTMRCSTPRVCDSLAIVRIDR